jgi:putative thiamine transport system ATP-binding protein
MGRSGSGKSSLLAAIVGSLGAGLTQSGGVWLDGIDVTATPPHLRRIGILFQDDLLFPHMSVAGNLGFGLPRGGARAERAKAIGDALAEVALDGFEDRDPATLSGGQRARVALARVLLSRPKALLLDEPFSRLDAQLRDQVRTMVFEKARVRGLPVILVTHDISDAEAAGGPRIDLDEISKFTN